MTKSVAKDEKQYISLEEHDALKKEFSDFAYIVSHDLNAPLRHVREFSKLLISELGNKITDNESKYVEHIENGINRTEAMIEGLLEYSRLNTQGEDFKKIDMNKVFGEVKASLSQQIKTSNAQIEINPLPPIIADQKQIKQLFFYLLDNAIKFRKLDTPPKITIFGAQKDGMHIFSFRDNGVGVPEEQHENIFTMFRRLPGADNLPGIGVGLTLAKKIVERHSGKIWAESHIDGGTTINFTLSAAV